MSELEVPTTSWELLVNLVLKNTEDIYIETDENNKAIIDIAQSLNQLRDKDAVGLNTDIEIENYSEVQLIKSTSP
jgi:hypothetical protein